MFENPDLIKAMAFENAKRLSAKDQCILAERYLFGKGVEKDLVMAFKLYEMSAKNNYKDAKFNLARMYLKGDGTTKNVAKAIEILNELAKKNDIGAIDRLAFIYYSGEGVEKDKELAVKLYTKSASMGSQEGAYQLASIYHHDDTIEHDFKKAKKYYEILAKKGLSEAICNLGYLYEHGEGVDQDYETAIKYYKKAAESGHAIACYNLGCAYFDGRIIDRDYEKAYKYFTQSAEQGFAAAKYSLGYMYFKGQGAELNLKKAKELFESASNGGDGQASYVLGYMYNVGKGVEQDFKKAIECYELAVKNGNPAGYSDIGFMYNCGRGVKVDHKKAVEFFQKGVSLNDDASKCNLAVACVKGSGIKKDINKAIELLNSVNDEFVNKFYYLGTIKCDCLNNGEKTKEVIEDAVGYYKKYLEYVMHADDKRYLPIIYYKLSVCYLDLYYLDEANEKDRTKQHFLKDNQNRKQAKEYLKKAKELPFDLEGSDIKIFENDLRIAEDLLNDESLDLTNLNYQEFKEKFFGKHENLFLLTNKKEFELYDEGVKLYFEKREKESEVKQKIALAEENFEKRKSLIRKRLEELKISNIDEKLNELKSQEIEKTVNSLDVDFSNSVINIDKHLEEILHFVFVDCMHEHKLDLYKQLVSRNIEDIKNLLSGCSQETLSELNVVLNGINKTVKLDKNVLTKKIEIFSQKFNKNWNWKNIAEDRIAELNTYFDDNKDSLNRKETKLIKKLLENSEARTEFANLEKPDKFELGKLFYMAFADTDIGNGFVAQKVVDPEFIDFVLSINKNMPQNEASLKLSELLVKVEMFRVVVRNVASHKTPLTQSAVEQGINISLVQENSIYKLLDELFGDFLNEKYVHKIVEELEI